MKVEFTSSFLRDLKHLRDKEAKDRVAQLIELVEKAERIEAISGLKRLAGEGRYFRIRVGDYRAGLLIEGDILVFVRFLHRKDIYRYFP